MARTKIPDPLNPEEPHSGSHDGLLGGILEAQQDAETEDGVALVFAKLYAGKLRYCHNTGAWFTWTGNPLAKR